MNIRSFLCLAVTLLVAGAAAAKEKMARIPAPDGVLPVVITEMTVGNSGNAYSDYDRLAYALEQVAKERKWPVKISAERVASNAPDYLTELRISLQRVRQEVPGEYLYRAWTSLTIDGKEHDLKIVSYSYRYRMGENMDDVMEKSFLGGAKATADKIEPLLFPDLKADKK
jgi:hypothetical protein